ncbi:MAG TPA: ATP-binding protein [Kofleriaceae bacterium]|nr:ATP-binding protein [Kofleriaceae bacterium]
MGDPRQRFEKLRGALEALAGARTSKDVARVAVETGRDAVDAIAATIWLHDPSDGLFKVAASHNVAEDYLAPFRVIRPDSRLPVVRVTTTRTAMFVGNEQELAQLAPEMYPEAHNAGRIQPFAVLPLATEERALGAIAFTFSGRFHDYSDDERELLFSLTRACEQALERARLLEAEAEARRVAEEANRRKDEFLAMLGHELRNPLAAMSAAVDLIKLREATLSRELTILDRHLASLVHMVSDLLDVSRVTLGKVDLERTSCDVKRSIEQALESVQSEIDARGHTVSVDVAADLAVNADPERLTQVFVNLLANAVTYTPAGGRIHVTARDDVDDIVIDVRDNGVGIAATLVPTIFDAFVQGPRSLDRKPGGLGIGLTLVKQLVELHGGRVSVVSEGEDKGSTFSVSWPRAVGPTRTVKMPALGKVRPLRVLVVDHEVDGAHAFARVIEGMGHEVVVVHDAPDALAAGERFSAEIVFLDLAVGGYDLAKQLRAVPAFKAARVVALGSNGARDESVDGVTAHIAKPLDVHTLAELLSVHAS